MTKITELPKDIATLCYFSAARRRLAYIFCFYFGTPGLPASRLSDYPNIRLPDYRFPISQSPFNGISDTDQMLERQRDSWRGDPFLKMEHTLPPDIT